MNHPIIIIGFMGTGKTTVGSTLAKRLHMDFVDVDEAIVKNKKQSIADMFAQHGEAHFRKVECETLARLLAEQQHGVISCGGGIITHPESYELLKQQPYVIWLDTDLDVIAERVANDLARPNAANKSKEELISLFEKRFDLYRGAGRYRVQVVDETVPEVADKIAYAYKIGFSRKSIA